MKGRSTIVGTIDRRILEFTAGDDLFCDMFLVDADCMGTAAHVSMLASLKLPKRIISARQRDRIIRELATIMEKAAGGGFRISAADQDVHLAVERILTDKLGDLGRRVHTGRSRNDQSALDLRLFGKTRLLDLMDTVSMLASDLLAFGRRHRDLPMVGRTHMQPAMPSSVGLWASAHAESLLDDISLLRAAYEYNDKSPLGAAAGYGSPLPLDRGMTARLLGFGGGPAHNALYAINSRGKCEAVILSAVAQVMISLSRWAEDMLLYTMPEFGYFKLPGELGTGSSIMPQKNNPDALELIRARSLIVQGYASSSCAVVSSLPGGYNRDVQEIKRPFIEGLATAVSCCDIAGLIARNLKPDRKALEAGFTPGVFAADRALEMAAGGIAFRDAYNRVKEELDSGSVPDGKAALRGRTHEGAPCGLDWKMLGGRARAAALFARSERRRFDAAVSKLLGICYSSGRMAKANAEAERKA